MAPPRQATMPRLYARNGTPVVTGHPLSIISLVMLSVGGGALLLSIAVVSVYFYHVRRRRRRLRVRRNSLAEKIGEPILMHAPQHVQTAIDLKSMTPAMRLAHSTRTADMQRVQRAQEANAAHAQAALIAAQRWAAPLDNMAINSSSGFQQQASPRSSTEHSRPSLSAPRAPPLPHDSHARIQLARQQSIISQQSHKSQKSQKSITFVEPIKPSKAASAPNANPYPSIASSSRIASAAPVQAIPRLPTATDQAPQLTANRSLSPLPAPSILESESYTPVLEFGMEFGKANEMGTTDVGEERRERDSQMLLDPHSWLASALDSAFNVSALSTDETMFSEKPRQAPPQPTETVKHTPGHSVSSVSTKAAKKTAAPPPPASGPPQKFVKPTPGGAARVTVDYYTPYQRRTLYQSDGVDAVAAGAAMGANHVTGAGDAVEIVRDGNDIHPRPSTQLSGRTSIESSVRAAALFTVMEPALRSSSETQQRQEDACLAEADNSATSTASTLASSHGRFSSNRRAGDSTADTSIQIDNSVADDEKRIAITAVDHISPITGTFISPNATPVPLGSKWSVSNFPPQHMQRNENLSSANGNEKGTAFATTPFTKSPTFGSALVPSKSGFASSLRAKFNIARPRSAASSSAGTASPKWSQKSPTINQSSAFAPSMELSPALSSTTKETPPNSFGPPNLTWNVSTEDVGTPAFIRKGGMRSQTSLDPGPNASDATPVIGLGLRQGSDNAEAHQTGATSLPVVKALNAANRSPARPSRPPTERTRSISSQTSSRKSQDRYRAFPWSRTTGGPPSSAHGHAPTLGGHDDNEYEDADEEDLPRFADADSPFASPMRAAIASSAGHAPSSHARAIDDGGQWTLNRTVPANPRDSMASSCCDTIASSVTGHSDNYSAFESGNAQVQRAKLLESVQARKQAKQGGNANAARSQGFTSHSASLSIEMGAGPSANGAVKPKHSFLGGMLDVNISEPFMNGDGILTPPLTPFQATIGLPVMADVRTQQQPQPVKPSVTPPHARIRAPSQTQSSPTPEQRQAERMSKLRPLSLAASHPQQTGGVSSAGPGPRMPLNTTRKSVASSRTNSVAHGGAVTASSSYASMATSSSSGSGGLTAGHQASLAVIRQSSHSMASAHNGIQLPSISYKRVSRAGSTTSSHAMQHSPMGAIHGPGLSINASPNVPTIGLLPANSAPFRNGNTSTRAKQQGPTHIWLAASNAGLMSSSLDTPSTSSNLSSAAIARLSGSSFASHSSILARFPALANGMADVPEAAAATAV